MKDDQLKKVAEWATNNLSHQQLKLKVETDRAIISLFGFIIYEGITFKDAGVYNEAKEYFRQHGPLAFKLRYGGEQ